MSQNLDHCPCSGESAVTLLELLYYLVASWSDEQPNDVSVMGGFNASLGERPYVSPADLDNDLHNFVLNILASLITQEEARGIKISGLKVFARLDISVFRRVDGGKLTYMVNEITRGHAASLFLADSIPRTSERFIEAMADTLISYAQLTKEH
jgi:hypothetical protein